MKSETMTIAKIRENYTEKKPSKFDELKRLDRKVTRPAEIFAYSFGSISSLVLGAGMSLAMKVIGSSLSFAMPLGVGVGLVGIALVSVTYPIYKAILKSRRKKFAKQIFELSDALLEE